MTPPLTEYLEQVEKRLKAATKPYDFLRLEGHASDEFRYDVVSKAGFVAFYEGNYDQPMRAKFDAELFFHAPTDLATLLALVKRQRDALEFYAKGSEIENGPNEFGCGCCATMMKNGEKDWTEFAEVGQTARQALSDCEKLIGGRG